ncbi:Putative uncharacterized protein [Taphrina deformans PYCC 5710]|uniref:Protein PNS1 n=1 Tax=Taphrina deformans (strain PYCC 5710 / ATCC 11124 / CBS 356.35 / IMI 108563 / JCM 9778 / NBRC 8474) TaxID=1097556 RepID=R4XBU6_TAPDE|nr:Putative uncharacterized protein [Taphrina deformans PYCC 5710]|eukprot:CCG83274.1 Putative uncharacterized protein [Taphrina deformans PYCC 5710]
MTDIKANFENGNIKQGGTFNQKFPSPSKYKDPIFAVAYIACFLAFTVISGFSLNAFRLNKQGAFNSNQSFTLSGNTAILLGFVVVFAVAASAIYFALARAFTKAFIWITGILHIVTGIATGAYYIYEKQYPAGIIFLVFALFYAFCFWSWRGRIPLAALYLQFTLDVAKHYKSVYVVSALGTIVSALFSAWWSVTLVAAYAKYSPNTTSTGAQNPGCSVSGGSCSNASLILVIVFLTFTAYWVTEFIKNVIHTTICGIFGAFYYGVASPEGVPKHAAKSSFRRTVTYSFGSVAYGSLLVAVIQLIRQAVDMFTRYEAQSGDMMGAIFGCILQCFVGLLQWALQYFNKYVYVEVALYGKSYLNAARDTWHLIKQRGIDALINDSLISNVLSCGTTFIAYLTALLSYLYLKYTDPAYNATGGYYPVVMAVAFCIGLQIANTTVVPLTSGVATLFVCTAVNPEILRDHFPSLFSEMVKFYPQVMQGIV